jgi:DNA-binding FadR family transcriptional regulator
MLTVRRGNVGGALVHPPSDTDVARTIGLVLQFRHATLADIAEAMMVLEPMCAAMCARRRDRRRAVVPVLRQLTRAMQSAPDDGDYVEQAFRFHDEMIQLCGNETLRLVVGALDKLRGGPSGAWRRGDDAARAKARSTSIAAHNEITDAIATGDAEAAEDAVRRHLEGSEWWAAMSEWRTTVIAPDQLAPGDRSVFAFRHRR